MSDNVGLSTPRGSGTSGYVQRNLAHFRPRDNYQSYPPKDFDSLKHQPRQPDKGLLEHDRKREVEVKVFELRDKLEEEGIEEDEIETRCDELRQKLLAEMERNQNSRGAPTGPRKNLKMHQVHELADAKIKESERLRQALKISRDYQEGSHWKKQEERLKGALEREANGDSSSMPPPPAPSGPSGGNDRGGDRDRGRGRGFGRRDRDEGRLNSRERRAPPRDWDRPPTPRGRGGRGGRGGRDREVDSYRGAAGRDRSRSRSPIRERSRTRSPVRDTGRSRSPVSERSLSRSRSRSGSYSRSRSPPRRRAADNQDRSLSRSRSRSYSRSPDRDRYREKYRDRDDRD
ncbi:hypothetical protein NEUTE1DRAFT_121954 [Neurospora tetrasperma FGSC 2508]|uniref:CWF21 domain-containing protein n=1 Tax=Neurospora tetrasperma (strain FGSC 2508 / ATCC MYA-4615 / P0657) TaxID=510951 RepID=F8ML80_NEUT8|nr:uncharacterized protein NEUTE1DRAFT_121954 [Neurospora tetrasperma FGSC 2508]EGO57555.1 hypothetical protein NEUTE1DRAFT_121954 [Neurospora tetrasperma FGSC 2508]EGZ72185.1 cwf21-domain-containing protein [Neurospora tetrasperma FGSC 2509]